MNSANHLRVRHFCAGNGFNDLIGTYFPLILYGPTQSSEKSNRNQRNLRNCVGVCFLRKESIIPCPFTHDQFFSITSWGIFRVHNAMETRKLSRIQKERDLQIKFMIPHRFGKWPHSLGNIPCFASFSRFHLNIYLDEHHCESHVI